MKLLLKAPFLSVKVWSLTSLHPNKYTVAERRGIARDIGRLTRLSGISTRASKRAACSSATVASAPRSSGVYCLYSGEETVYIGASNDLRYRLSTHFGGSHNPEIADLIRLSNAYVDWYQSLYYAWMECLELAEYLRSLGRLPSYNKIGCGLPF